MLKTVLVGAGAHSRSSHGPSLAEYVRKHPGQIELAAVCDLDLEKARLFQREFGFQRVYEDLTQMVSEEKPDACVCVMPIHLVAEMGMKLLEHGIPTLLEKPPGTSIEQVRRLAEFARTASVPTMVSANRRFDPCLRRGIVWARRQGLFRQVRGFMARDRRTEPGFMWDTGFHCVDALREIGGEVVDFEVRRMDAGEAAWFRLELEFQDRFSGSLDVFPNCGCVEEKYEIFGEDFWAEIWVGNCAQPRVRCWRDGEIAVDEGLPVDMPGFVRGGTYAETEEFVNALLEGRVPRPSVEDVLPAAEICSACVHAESP